MGLHPALGYVAPFRGLVGGYLYRGLGVVWWGGDDLVEGGLVGWFGGVGLGSGLVGCIFGGGDDLGECGLVEWGWGDKKGGQIFSDRLFFFIT